MRITLNLKLESWKNLFKVIRDNKINSQGNFWASIQHLETQLEEIVEEERPFKTLEE